MDVLRLSDSVPCLLQMCDPCQRAFRQSQTTSYRRNFDQEPRTWSCQLCEVVRQARLSWQARHPRTTLERCLDLFQRLARRPLGGIYLEKLKFAQSTRLVGDLSDIIVLAKYLITMSPKFETRPVTLSNVLPPAVSPLPPIVRPVPHQKIDLSLVKRWMLECEKSHWKCRRVRERQFVHSDTELILIDVQLKKLVQKTTATRYLALSYVWGRVPQLLLKKDNLRELKTFMALHLRWNQIPKVLRDAINFTSSVGERYLWVDTLCIIQDSPKRFDETLRMNDIYKGATCTLIAVDCKDASCALPGFRSHTRQLKTIGQTHGLTFANRRPELALIFAESIYESRGWTFQERLLSSRCLYFTDEQLYFHCPTELWSEDRYEYFHQEANLYGNYPALTWPSASQHKTYAEKVCAYEHLVEQYTKRTLSFQTDRLNAFSGVANDIGSEWNWIFLYGLPLQAFHRSLLWDSSQLPQERIHDPVNDFSVPSWSWAGWTGPVNYQLHESGSINKSLSFELACFRIGDIDVQPHNKDFKLRISINGHVKRIHSKAPIEAITYESARHRPKNPSTTLPCDILSFWAEQVPKKKFSFVRTRVESRSFISGRPDNRVLRIFDRRMRACGVLFHSGHSPPGYPKSPYFRFSEASFQFILLASPLGRIVSYLDDVLVGEDDNRPNVYEEVYEKNGTGRTLTIMLIEWKSKTFAERIAIGEISKLAWLEAGPVNTHILLR